VSMKNPLIGLGCLPLPKAPIDSIRYRHTP
jgi:hypothetical protein